jgi:hypothetical protein
VKRAALPRSVPVDPEAVKRLQKKWIKSKSAHEQAKLEKARRYAQFWAAVEGKQPTVDFEQLPA